MDAVNKECSEPRVPIG